MLVSAGLSMWGLVHTLGGSPTECVRRGLRHVLLTMEATPYHGNYSTMFERTHSQVVVDDGVQTYMQKNRQPMMKKKRTMTSNNGNIQSRTRK